MNKLWTLMRAVLRKFQALQGQECDQRLTDCLKLCLYHQSFDGVHVRPCDDFYIRLKRGMLTLSAGGSAAASIARIRFRICSYICRVLGGDEVDWPWPQVRLILAPSAFHRYPFPRHWECFYKEGASRNAMTLLGSQYSQSLCTCCTFDSSCPEVCVCVRCAVITGFTC